MLIIQECNTKLFLLPQPYGLGLNETLMPQYLKQLGYATHAVGKVRIA